MEKYMFDGMPVSETRFNELVKLAEDNTEQLFKELDKEWEKHGN